MQTGGLHNLLKTFPSVILDIWGLTWDFMGRHMLRSKSHFSERHSSSDKTILFHRKSPRESIWTGQQFKNVPVGKQEVSEKVG